MPKMYEFARLVSIRFLRVNNSPQAGRPAYMHFGMRPASC